MPLEILLALVVFGIAGITCLTILLGMNRRRVLRDDAEVMHAWRRELTSQPQSVTRAANGHAALVHTADGPGLVWTMGADTTARLLTGARAMRTKRGLTLRLPDITAPRIRLTLDPSEVEHWAKTIETSP